MLLLIKLFVYLFYSGCQLIQDVMIGSGCIIGENTSIDCSVVGENCRIGKNVKLEGCFLFNNVVIEVYVLYYDCFIYIILFYLFYFLWRNFFPELFVSVWVNELNFLNHVWFSFLVLIINYLVIPILEVSCFCNLCYHTLLDNKWQIFSNDFVFVKIC